MDKVTITHDAVTLKVVLHALEHMGLQVQATANEINRQVNEAIAAEAAARIPPPAEPPA
jgi:predicted transcriptional regulator YheO